MNIAIFLGASMPTNKIYFAMIQELIDFFRINKINIIYGGTNVGLMGYMADLAIKNNIYITGIITDTIKDIEVTHLNLNKLIKTNSLSSRKEIMFKISDICIALPGGFGTLDEIFEAITWNQIGLHNKKIFFLNFNNYFNDIKNFIKKMVQENFLSYNFANTIDFLDNIDELYPYLNQRNN